MATLRNLVEYARHSLTGYDSSKDSVATLVSAVSASATVLAADSVGDTGIAEIGTELVRIKAADSGSGALVIFPFGRGYRGTVATAHAAGEEITYNPAWPVGTLAREINSLLDVIYPRIYVAAETTVDVDQWGFVVVPTIATKVLAVKVQDGDGQWQELNRWQWDPHIDAGDNRTLRLSASLRINTTVRVVYMQPPGKFDLSLGLDQEFTTVTGLPARVESIINLGLAARLAPFIDVSRLPTLAAEARLEGQNRPGDNGTIARLLDNMFNRAVEQEAARLNQDHPIKSHRTVI